MKKSHKIILAVGAVFVSLVMISVLTLNVFTLMKVNAVEQTVNEKQEPEENAEDGVVIGEDYKVISTKNISDAYISGNTDGLSAEDKETLETASDILKDITRDGMSDYDKEYAVFTWINENIKIDGGSMTLIQDDPKTVSTPQGVLKNKKAVCVGFATTFRLFMQMLDIPCMVVHNTDMVHTWDLVKIDGSWYHTDLYSASGSGGYYYLNLPDSMMDQVWDNSYYPAAAELKDCYMFKNAAEISDVYQIPSELRKKLDSKEEYLSLIIKNSGKNAVDLTESVMYELTNRLTNSVEYFGYSLQYRTVSSGTDVFMAAVIYYPNQEEEPYNYSELVDEDKFSEAFKKAFGELTDVEYDDYPDWEY